MNQRAKREKSWEQLEALVGQIQSYIGHGIPSVEEQLEVCRLLDQAYAELQYVLRLSFWLKEHGQRQQTHEKNSTYLVEQEQKSTEGAFIRNGVERKSTQTSPLEVTVGSMLANLPKDSLKRELDQKEDVSAEDTKIEPQHAEKKNQEKTHTTRPTTSVRPHREVIADNQHNKSSEDGGSALKENEEKQSTRLESYPRSLVRHEMLVSDQDKHRVIASGVAIDRIEKGLTLNDRSRFVNALFRGDAAFFSHMLKKLNAASSLAEALEIFHGAVEMDSDSPEQSDFVALLVRRFS